MKKGFTLIELIAVILILGFIALITVPKALDVIEDSKKESVVNSAKVYVKAVNEAIINERMNKNKIGDGTYSIMNNGLLCIGIIQADSTCSGKTIDLGLKSNNFSCGYVRVSDGKVSELENVQSSKYSINKTNNNYTVEEGYKCFSGCFAITEKAVTGYYDNENNSTNYNFCPRSVIMPDDVNVIGEWSFSRKNITKVILSSNITSICEYAFEGNNITGILDIPNSVESIGTCAFCNQSYDINAMKIDKVNLGKNIKKIGDAAFRYNNITGTLELPNSVTSIGKYAFEGNNITEIKFPNDIKLTELTGFGYNSITKIEFPDSVTSIGDDAFAGNKLETLVLPNKITTISGGAFASTNLTKLTLPSELKTIGSNYARGAFENNNLTEIVLPDGLSDIGSKAFENNNLTSIIIPDSVTSIEDNAFHCNPLREITIGSGISYIGYKAFYKSNGCKEQYYNPTVTINRPKGTVTLGSLAFRKGTVIKYTDGDVTYTG